MAFVLASVVLAAVAPHPRVVGLMRMFMKNSADPEKCMAELFQNYQTVVSCASRTCQCAGGTWSTQAPYCTGPALNCASAKSCFSPGYACITAVAPDCGEAFEKGCQVAVAAAKCDASTCSTNATAARRESRVRNHVASPATDAVKQILLGIVEGIEGDVGNISLCLPEEESVWTDLQTFVADVKDALATGNWQEAVAGFQQLLAAAKLAQQAAVDCGLETVAADLATIVAELETPGGWLKVLEQEGWKIFIHARDVTGDIQSAIQDYRAGNWNAFGQDLGRVLGLLL